MKSQSAFFRNANNKVIAGVCSGIALKLNLDPVLMRLIFVLLAIFGGGGVLAYVILWIVLPERYEFKTFSSSEVNSSIESDEDIINETVDAEPIEKNSGNSQLIFGLILIALGGLFLVAAFIPRISIHNLWPIVLIVIGLLLLKPSSY